MPPVDFSNIDRLRAGFISSSFWCIRYSYWMDWY